jgi:hypothetical protein
MAEAPDLNLPPRFRVVRPLGSGAMGYVLEAFDEERGVTVALKTLRHVDAEALVRFKNEFRTLADIGHENLVALGELLEHEGQWFFTMELVRGVDLLGWVRPGVDVGAREADVARAAETLPAASNPRGSVAGDPNLRTGTLDAARVRTAFAQLVRALDALHSAGKVHRDVKPSNVLVTTEDDAAGRVVLLDFGIAGDAAKHTRAAGTVAYMAPEQAESHAPTPAADLYAVGVVLYEALTGALPFEGSAFEVLEAKRRGAPPHPTALASDVPPDLAVLALALLDPEPTARPGAADVLRALGEPDAPLPRTTLPPESTAAFVGRRRELAELLRAWATVEQGHAVTVYVHGESGVGKTALLRHFADEITVRSPHALVLTSRCYERESVPFKAVDGVVDALRDLFAEEDRTTLGELLPHDAGLLARVFPVLAPAVARLERRPDDEPPDEEEQRARVFDALRSVFAALAARRPVVLLLEDLQWADADSLLLLRELLRPPEPPPLLLLATVRTAQRVVDHGGPPSSLPQSRLNVGSGAMPGDVRPIALGRLAREDAERYAELLGAGLRAHAIAEEAGGHPLLVEELVLAAAPGASLRDVVAARRDALSPTARRVLDFVLLARAPVPEVVLARAAADDDGTLLDRAASELRQAHLARRVNARGRPALEPYHGRVRETLEPEPRDRSADHRALARAFEAEATAGELDREALAEHWRGAGDVRRASDHAIAAAREAAARLAFDRAARLHEWALALVGDAATERELGELADARRNAGRGAEAGDAYLAAAARATGARARDLRRCAAHELFASGHTDAGSAALAPALRELGIAAEPSGFVAALRDRAASLFGKRAFRPRPANEIDPEARARAEALHTLALGFTLVDPKRAHAVATRAVPIALATGDATSAARALAASSIVETLCGIAPARLAEAEALARGLEDPTVEALCLVAASAARFHADDFAAARDRARDARRIARERARGATWELTAATWLTLRALAIGGELARATAEAQRALESAETRGDRLGQALFASGWIELVRLAQGDVDGVRATRDARAQDLPSPRARLDELVARGALDLYVGDGTNAYRRSTESLRPLEDAGALAAPVDRAQVLALHARAAILHARSLPHRARELLDEATAVSNRIAGLGTRYALLEASLVRGAIARARGDGARAIASYQSANGQSAELGLRLHGAAAALAAGRLRGGTAGRAQVERALGALRRAGVTDPDALAAVFGA